MKIYSWNILYRNRDLNAAFEFISHADFDVFCLQEVTEGFLKRLQTLPYHCAFRTDVERILPQGVVRNYVVTLSKYPIIRQGEIPFPEYWSHLPLRTRIFVRLMPSRYFSKIRNRGGLFVDIAREESTVRVFNLHLILAHPAWRLREFELAMAEHDPLRPAIVCGDLNTLERPHIGLLNWILGGRVGDALFYNRERIHIEKRFVVHELTNAFAGEVTHTLSRSQLDHILVSHSLAIKNTTVIPERYGSDHHPLCVEIA